MKFKKIKSPEYTYYIREDVFLTEFGDEKKFFENTNFRRMANCEVVIGEFNTVVKCRFDMETIIDAHTKGQS